MLFNVSANQLFPNKVDLYFRPCISTCTCGGLLKTYKTMTREKSTLVIGDFTANITQVYCETCHKIYGSEEIKSIIPKGSHFGYDVIEFIGRSLFNDHMGDEQIQKLLREKNITISLREISYLGKKFIIYLALAHQSCQNKINNFIKSNGGYILHLDGTREKDSPHLFSFIDEISRIVLGNIKIASENTKLIKPKLEEIKKIYGNPVAIVHDMSSAIINAVESVFPDVKDFICHFHFLRDLGKDLFNTEYSSIKRCLKSLKIRTILRAFARALRNYIVQDDDLKNCLDTSLQKNFFKNGDNSQLMVPVSFYLLVTWVLESKNKSHGYGFPFDRQDVDFYDRLKAVYPIIKILKNKMPTDSPKLSLKQINHALNDSSLINSLTMIKEKVSIFDELRNAMRIVLPDGKNGLNDSGDDIDIKKIESGVKKFRESDRIIQLSKNDIRFKKMVKQIDKYWEKLFADPIFVKTEMGDVMMQPQRTNNLLEQFFRDIKRGSRKKSGTSSLSKTLKVILANTPLIKNLKIAEYEQIILGGKKNLAERFAEIDITAVRTELRREDDAARKYPKGMARIFRLPNLPNKISQFGQKMINNS
jgi:hypothetical protein